MSERHPSGQGQKSVSWWLCYMILDTIALLGETKITYWLLEPGIMIRKGYHERENIMPH